MDPQPGVVEYSIAAVSKLTGISCHALRIWERRYGFPIPGRSSSGQRRYDSNQVWTLRLIARALKSGKQVGEVMREMPWLAEPAAERLGCVSDLAEDLETILRQTISGSEAALDGLEMSLTPEEFLVGVIEPLLLESGERHARGELRIYESNLISGVVLRRLVRLLEAARKHNAVPRRTAIVATVAGDRHEGGMLMLALALELSNWRAMILGADLPVSEIRRAVDSRKPDAVGVSFILSRNINKRFEELSSIESAPVFVGGRSLLNHERLARNRGLIPLTGSISGAIREWLAEFDGLIDSDRPTPQARAEPHVTWEPEQT